MAWAATETGEFVPVWLPPIQHGRRDGQYADLRAWLDYFHCYDCYSKLRRTHSYTAIAKMLDPSIPTGRTVPAVQQRRKAREAVKYKIRQVKTLIRHVERRIQSRRPFSLVSAP